jgi:hypothetical protein
MLSYVFLRPFMRAFGVGLWPLLIPLISAGVSAAGAYLGRNKQSAEQKANLSAQNQFANYQLQRSKRLDPMHEALIRMASGMLPDYAQQQYGFDQWGGFGDNGYGPNNWNTGRATPRVPRVR